MDADNAFQLLKDVNPFPTPTDAAAPPDTPLSELKNVPQPRADAEASFAAITGQALHCPDRTTSPPVVSIATEQREPDDRSRSRRPLWAAIAAASIVLLGIAASFVYSADPAEAALATVASATADHDSGMRVISVEVRSAPGVDVPKTVTITQRFDGEDNTYLEQGTRTGLGGAYTIDSRIIDGMSYFTRDDMAGNFIVIDVRDMMDSGSIEPDLLSARPTQIDQLTLLTDITQNVERTVEGDTETFTGSILRSTLVEIADREFADMPPGLDLVVGRTAIVELELPETIELAVVASGGVVNSLTLTVFGDTPTGLVDAVVTMQLSELGQAQSMVVPPANALEIVDPADLIAPDADGLMPADMFPEEIPPADIERIRHEMAIEMAIEVDVRERRPRLCIEYASPTEDLERRAELLEAQIDCFEAAGEQPMADLLRSQLEMTNNESMGFLPAATSPFSVVVHIDSADFEALRDRRPELCRGYQRFGPVPTSEDLISERDAMVQCLTDADEPVVAQIVLDMYPTDIESEGLIWPQPGCVLTFDGGYTPEKAEAAVEAQQQCLAAADN